MRIPEGPVWWDGDLVAAERAVVEITDPAVQTGLGLFETLAVRDGLVLDWEAHLDRLRDACRRMDVTLPEDEKLGAGAAAVAAQVKGGLGWLKVIAMRGGRCVIFSGSLDAEQEPRRLSAILLPWRRSATDPLAGLKTVNYAGFTLGMEEARRRGADEGIWLNHRGHIAEGCSSSLFVVWRRKIFTPAVRDGILPGVTRSLVLEAARKLKLIVHEGKVRLKRLETAQEAFVSSSVRGVRPMVLFEGRPVGNGEPGPITRIIAREVETLRRPWRPPLAVSSE